MLERKYLVHYVKVPTNVEDYAAKIGTSNESQIQWTWVRIGQHLENFAEEMNPQVDIRKNIWGYQTAIHNGYQVSSNVDTFYETDHESDNDYYLDKFLEAIVLHRWQGDMCRTERVDARVSLDVITGGVISSEAGNLLWAWKEDCYLVPQSHGGDTSGAQIPFQISNLGNREDVTTKFTVTNKVMAIASGS